MNEDKVQQILDELRDLKFEFIEFKTRIETELISKEKECVNHRNKMANIEKVIYGNGNKGIKQQITEIETKVAIYITLLTILINFVWKTLIK